MHRGSRLVMPLLKEIPPAQLRQIQHRPKYLEQEVEFFKNILGRKYTQARAAAMNEPAPVFPSIHQALSDSKNELCVSMMCRIENHPRK